MNPDTTIFSSLLSAAQNIISRSKRGRVIGWFQNWLKSTRGNERHRVTVASRGAAAVARRQDDHRRACLQAYREKARLVQEGRGNNSLRGIPDTGTTP